MRTIGIVLVLSLAGCVSSARAQVKESLVNEEGAEAPCLGIGVGMALVSKCVKMSEDQGFIRVGEVGYSGITLGTAGKEDGKVTAVAAGSPASAAGITVGETVVAVNGKPARRTPGTIAYSMLFGEKGADVSVKTKHAGAVTETRLVRTAAPAPPNAPKGNMFLIIHPIIDWRGQFVPCMGAGIAAAASFSYCEKLFKPYSFVKVSNLGTTGIVMDRDRTDAAVIAEIEAGSPAAAAGLHVGDEVVEIDGKPLEASVGENANEEMFAKAGESIKVTVRGATGEKTVELKLAAKPKG